MDKWINKPIHSSPDLTLDKKRMNRYQKQFDKYGYSDVETWNLFSNIANFTLPRLKRFKLIVNGYPPDLSEKKWEDIIDEMIFALNYAANCDDIDTDNNSKTKEQLAEYHKRVENGFQLFAKYFMHLWW